MHATMHGLQHPHAAIGNLARTVREAAVAKTLNARRRSLLQHNRVTAGKGLSFKMTVAMTNTPLSGNPTEAFFLHNNPRQSPGLSGYARPEPGRQHAGISLHPPPWPQTQPSRQGRRHAMRASAEGGGEGEEGLQRRARVPLVRNGLHQLLG